MYAENPVEIKVDPGTLWRCVCGNFTGLHGFHSPFSDPDILACLDCGRKIKFVIKEKAVKKKTPPFKTGDLVKTGSTEKSIDKSEVYVYLYKQSNELALEDRHVVQTVQAYHARVFSNLHSTAHLRRVVSTTRVKKQEDILLWLSAHGYQFVKDSVGDSDFAKMEVSRAEDLEKWPSFGSDMWAFCGVDPDDSYVWHPEWLETVYEYKD